jgi:hypothetical protein
MTKPRRGTAKSGPISEFLVDDSSLRPEVRPGIQGLLEVDKSRLAMELRKQIGDSLNLDDVLKAAHPNDNRWDYLVGISQSNAVVAIEVHHANSDQVSVIIRKKIAAKSQLQSHTKSGFHIRKWVWISSGAVNILRLDKEKLRLAAAGIQLVGRTMTAAQIDFGK